MNIFKISILLVVSLLASNNSFAQPQIVEWSYEIVEDGDAHKLVINGDIKDDWVIYSQHTGADGPIPTSIELTTSDDYTFEGDVKEVSKSIKSYSELFEVDVIKFKEQAIFEQVITNYSSGSVVKGTITYMSCNSKQCLPPQTIEFEVKG